MWWTGGKGLKLAGKIGDSGTARELVTRRRSETLRVIASFAFVSLKKYDIK